MENKNSRGALYEVQCITWLACLGCGQQFGPVDYHIPGHTLAAAGGFATRNLFTNSGAQ